MLDFERFTRVPLEGGHYYGPSNYGIDYSQINGWGIYEWSPLITYGSIYRHGPGSDISSTNRPNFCIYKGKIYQAMWDTVDAGIMPTSQGYWRDISNYIFNYTNYAVVDGNIDISSGANGLFDITFGLDTSGSQIATTLKTTRHNDTQSIVVSDSRFNNMLMYTTPVFSHTSVYLDGYRVPNIYIDVNRSNTTTLTNGNGNRYQDEVYSYIKLTVRVDGMYFGNTFNAPFYDKTNRVLKDGTQIQVQFKYTRI